MAYQAHVTTHADGARADFRVFEGETPNEGEIIKIAENGSFIMARVIRVLPRTGSQIHDHIEAVEV